MNKLILLALIMLFSCQNRSKQLFHIEVFESDIAVGINAPVEIGDSWVERVTPYTIEDSTSLTVISTLIKSLKPSTEQFSRDEIRLRCVMSYQDGTKSVLDFNRTLIDFDGDVYEYSSQLKNVLTSTK